MATKRDDRTLKVADVALDAKTGGLHSVFTYSATPQMKVGDAVAVSVGPRTALGFVVGLREVSQEELGFPASQLKGAQSTISGFALPQEVIQLVRHVTEEYLCPLPVAITAALPPGAHGLITRAWSVRADADRGGESTLAVHEREVLAMLRDMGKPLVEPRTKKLDPGLLRALKSLRSQGFVEDSIVADVPTESRKAGVLLKLTDDADKIERFLKANTRKRPAQALTLVRLQEIDHPALAASDIRALCGVTETTIRALTDAGLLTPLQQDASVATPAHTPNRHQVIAIDALIAAVESRISQRFLLFGVTGSGKTEVYLRAAQSALKMGHQVLFLVPEIALASQAVSLLRERFGGRVALLHSDLTASQRIESWMSVRSGEAPVVIGARSAAFAPLSNLGLIVMDEEHEGSYKQEAAPRYHARSLGEALSRIHSCPIVFGSATPSVETFHEADEDKITLLSLPERAAKAQLPTVEIVDLREGFRTGQPSLFAPRFVERLRETLDRGEQAILFLNRRAYAPFLVCRDCGFQFKCPNCAVSLSYSKRTHRLRCHHCLYQTSAPEICPSCEGSRIRVFGVGTERVEDSIRELFPDARVARLDRDVAQKRGALEQVLAGFAAREIDILVGTQMVAKGLNFPHVTMVGVVAADISLNVPDFRATERTFQLLAQVAGRAGRGQSPGYVVIQTMNPDHPALQRVVEHDYLGLFEAERAERAAVRYPPFVRLVNVVLSGESRKDVESASSEAAQRIRRANAEATLLGPTDCAIERLNNRWRRHLLLKLNPQEPLNWVGQALAGFEPHGVQVVIDVDPNSLV